MGFRTEEQTQAFGAPTRSELQDRNERARHQDKKANRRYLIAKTLAGLTGSLRFKRKFIEQAIESGLISQGSVPSVETIRSLEARWRAGAQSIEDYYDNFRPGRPQEVLPTAIEGEIRDVIYSGRAINARNLTGKLEVLALKLGVEAPTYRQVHSRFARAGRLVRAAARHGSRAGEIDGLPHASVVSRYAHDTWALDELTLPVWVGLYSAGLGRRVSARVDVVLVVDVCSGAVVGYHVVDPTRRIDQEGMPFLAGFDSDDVFGALLSAACPELASDSTRPFAGYLPDRLRWDNAQAHETVMAWLKDAAVEIDIRPIRKRRAASNGAVERRVGILKSHCQGILGHVDDYLPTDQVVNDEAANLALQRTIIAGYSSQRETRLQPIHPEQLLSMDDVRVEFDRIVHRYNFELRNRVHGLTPKDRHEQRRKSRRPRRGLDLVRAIEPRTVTVSREGIIHHADGLSHRFFPLVGGKIILLDMPVTYHPDPLARGIFVQDGDRRLEFVAPQSVRSDDEAAEIAKNQTSITRMISDGADARRQDEMRQSFGQHGLDAAMAEYDRQVERLKDAAPDSIPEADKVGLTPPTRAEAAAIDPWSMDDPTAFIRPQADDQNEEE